MGMLESLMGNETLINLATSKLRNMFTDGGLKAIVLTYEPDSKEGPLPGFGVSMYKVEISVIDSEQFKEHTKMMEAHPHHLTAEEWADYENLKLQRDGNKS